MRRLQTRVALPCIYKGGGWSESARALSYRPRNTQNIRRRPFVTLNGEIYAGGRGGEREREHVAEAGLVCVCVIGGGECTCMSGFRNFRGWLIVGVVVNFDEIDGFGAKKRETFVLLKFGITVTKKNQL